MKIKNLFITHIIILLITVTHLYSEGLTFDTIKDIDITSSYSINSDKTINVKLDFKINGEVHIQKNDLLRFSIKNKDFQLINITYPAPDKWKNNPVFKDEFSITIILKNLNNTEKASIPIEVNYQCCDEITEMCYMPVSRIITVDYNIEGSTSASQSLSEKFKTALDTNIFIAFLLVFIAGFLASLTPCVYPIIPITIGYIGSRSSQSKWKGFILSLFFVLGLSITYSILGIIAAKTGSVFGSIMQTPVVLGIIALIFIIMSLSMFGAFDIQLPPSISAKLQSHGQKKGIAGAIIIGMITGLIAAPCVGPIIISLLAWIAKTGSILLGFWLLFVFAWGMGILFIIIGTFAGALSAMPKSGKWMEFIKYFFGILLLATGFYYLHIVLTISLYYILLGIAIIIPGTFAFSTESKDWKAKLYSALKYIIIIIGAFYIFAGLLKIYSKDLILTSPTRQVNLTDTFNFDYTDNDAKAFEDAKKNRKPLFIDFYADWCAECKELEEKTYNDPEVKEKLKNFITLKMNFTKKSEWTKNKTEQYKIAGLPTVIFFNPDGKEIYRFFGFKDKKEFLNIINKIQ